MPVISMFYGIIIRRYWELAASGELPYKIDPL